MNDTFVIPWFWIIAMVTSYLPEMWFAPAWFSWIIAKSFEESNSPMTFRLLDAEDGSCNDFFPHILATEPSRSLRINSSMWMLLSKHRSSKLSKQVMNLPCVVKLARCVLTNLLQCNDIPAWWFEVLLHPWTTQRILYLKKSDNRLNKRKSAKILSSNAAFQFICMKITMWSFPLASLTSLPLLAPSLMLRGRNMLD